MAYENIETPREAIRDNLIRALVGRLRPFGYTEVTVGSRTVPLVKGAREGLCDAVGYRGGAPHTGYAIFTVVSLPERPGLTDYSALAELRTFLLGACAAEALVEVLYIMAPLPIAGAVALTVHETAALEPALAELAKRGVWLLTYELAEIEAHLVGLTRLLPL